MRRTPGTAGHKIVGQLFGQRGSDILAAARDFPDRNRELFPGTFLVQVAGRPALMNRIACVSCGCALSTGDFIALVIAKPPRRRSDDRRNRLDQVGTESRLARAALILESAKAPERVIADYA